MAKPKYRLNITKRVEGTDGPVWLPVGSMSIWEKDGKLSGKLRLNVFGDNEFHIFPADKGEKVTTVAPDADDIPFPEKP